MTEFIFGNQLLKQYDMTPIDLFNLVQRGDLTPYSGDYSEYCRPDRKPPRYIQELETRIENLESQKWALKSNDQPAAFFLDNDPIPIVKIKQIDEEIGLINVELKQLKKNIQDPYDWKNFRLPENKSEAKAVIDNLTLCYYREAQVSQVNMNGGLTDSSNPESYIADNSNRINPLPSQRHKIAVIKVAREIWGQKPDITIAEMIGLDAINLVCEGKVYSEKTLRNWIKEYCPNRSQGRRPKRSV